ncbi:MAG: hypothetical protein ACFFB5_12725 [Promethearchaeota archaeon]
MQNSSTSSNSSSSFRDETEKLLINRFPLLLNLPDEMKEYIINDIANKLSKIIGNPERIEKIQFTNYSNILKGLKKLNIHMKRTRELSELIEILDLMCLEPFTVFTLLHTLAPASPEEKARLKVKIYSVIHILERVGIFSRGILGPGMFGILPNKKLRQTGYWYIKGLHTEKDIDESVFSVYRGISPRIGYRRDQKTTEQELTEKVLKKKFELVMESGFDISKQGAQINKNIHRAKSFRKLMQKRTDSEVLRKGTQISDFEESDDNFNTLSQSDKNSERQRKFIRNKFQKLKIYFPDLFENHQKTQLIEGNINNNPRKPKNIR